MTKKKNGAGREDDGAGRGEQLHATQANESSCGINRSMLSTNVMWIGLKGGELLDLYTQTHNPPL